MLPKITYPTYVLTVPSSNVKLRFRPFTVKEEKLLLMAKESNTDADMLAAIKQIVNNCATEDVDVNKLTVFDLEYMFLKLRAYSVDNVSKLAYKDLDDGKTYEFEVDLFNVEVSFPEKMDGNIKITDATGIVMKYPSASLYDDQSFLNLQREHLFELIIRCIDKVYDGEEVYQGSDYTPEQLGAFLETLDSKTFLAIQEFLSNAPSIKHVITYKNEFGTERTITLSSLSDFFTWR